MRMCTYLTLSVAGFVCYGIMFLIGFFAFPVHECGEGFFIDSTGV